MNRRHFLLWLGSIGVSAAAGAILNKPEATAQTLNKAAVPPRPPAPAKPVVARSPVSLVYDQDYLLYEGPKVGSFWESPTRLQAIVQRLDAVGIDIDTHSVKAATVAQIERAHTPSYVRYIQNAKYLPQDEFALIRKVEKRIVNRPTPTASGTVAPTSKPQFEHVVRYVRPPAEAPRYSKLKPFEAAALAAGGAIQAVDQVMSGKTDTAFALLRPPGHHATRSRNMGFCVFNNAAVAARHAQAAHGAKRVLIVDWDVHHGNGTQEIFYTDPSVLYFSTHQENIYPKRTGKVSEIGAKAGKGYNINVPLPAQTGDAGFLAAFREILVPVTQAFKPDLIIVSAGQDAHAGEFVASCRLTDAGFAQLTRVVQDLANELCGGKMVFVLEGGYNPKVTARAVESIVRAIADPPAPVAAGPRLAPALSARLRQVKQTQIAFWPVLA